jgi:hypothetical protein
MSARRRSRRAFTSRLIIPTRVRWALAVLAVFLVTTGHGALTFTLSQNFDAVGLAPDRSFFGELPGEAIDMATGYLNLAYTDVVLRGNGGMAIVAERTLNYANGIQWNIGLGGGLPIALVGVDATPLLVGVQMTDGTSHLVP